MCIRDRWCRLLLCKKLYPPVEYWFFWSWPLWISTQIIRGPLEIHVFPQFWYTSWNSNNFYSTPCNLPLISSTGVTIFFWKSSFESLVLINHLGLYRNSHTKSGLCKSPSNNSIHSYIMKIYFPYLHFRYYFNLTSINCKVLLLFLQKKVCLFFFIGNSFL